MSKPILMLRPFGPYLARNRRPQQRVSFLDKILKGGVAKFPTCTSDDASPNREIWLELQLINQRFVLGRLW